ncbi:carbohydrate ABC transporter permease [Micromonospora sp. MS34]|uniref:carbohydrate ABC transporter permease n=1 Tax=Micromonospora sp. MS34 TaxID=3385971 RepID=UPI0039A1FA99
MGFRLTRRVLLAVYAALIIVPLLVVVFGTFKTSEEIFRQPLSPPMAPSLDNYRQIFTDGSIGQAFGNSVTVTLLSVSLTLVVSAMTAFAVARLPGWRGNLLYALFSFGMAVPAQANMIPQYTLFDRIGLTDTLLGLVIVNCVVTMPVAVFVLGGFMKTLPRQIFEAAEIDGARLRTQFLRLAVPLSAPSLAATAVFLFVMHWNDLLYPLLFIQDESLQTLPLRLLGFKGEYLTDYPLLFTGVVVASVPMVVAYVFLQRYFVAGITAGAVKG